MKEDTEMSLMTTISEKLGSHKGLRIIQSKYDSDYIEAILFKNGDCMVRCAKCNSHKLKVRALIDASLVVNSTEKPAEVESIDITKVNMINVLTCAKCGGDSFVRTFIFKGDNYE